MYYLKELEREKKLQQSPTYSFKTVQFNIFKKYQISKQFI